MVTEPDDFNRVGGCLCLDFTNTLDGARGGRTQECLTSYAVLVGFAREAGLLSPREARALGREAAARPEAARRVLRRAVALREAIYAVVTATAAGRSAAPADLDVLNTELKRAMSRASLSRVSGGLDWTWTGLADELDGPLWPLARSAAELLTSPELERVHACGAEKCTWLFLDTTRNHKRRWCDMKTCGNVAKVRAYRQRKG